MVVGLVGSCQYCTMRNLLQTQHGTKHCLYTARCRASMIKFPLLCCTVQGQCITKHPLLRCSFFTTKPPVAVLHSAQKTYAHAPFAACPIQSQHASKLALLHCTMQSQCITKHALRYRATTPIVQSNMRVIASLAWDLAKDRLDTGPEQFCANTTHEHVWING